MKKYIKKGLMFLMLTIGIIPMLAFAAPGIPHQFYGTAKYTNGSDITNANVIVKIGDTTVSTVPISNGKYGYNPNLMLITDADNNRAGSTLKFFIGGTDTGKTATFSNGGYAKLDLSITAPPSGGGGGGSSPTPTTTKVGDATGDNTINEYDFAMLMADWGKMGASAADLNNDNVVDEYDFALLMLNWGL
ncbi:MAG: dockerin type I domain-containing protein [Candidatus Paceibacterota bacterium]